ncbi:ElyC/SanA/YdcF family protein [Vibrio barjaei]|jgi:hypothetical protein|uniref:ElyC/SanA/YdcF family protein n=1 Tax=Vibrio barjaei TaxID=1676683 RepID=UPI002284C806|nr:hypothetical protein [Vibrio barjaei]MCY9874482.1 hypothetical protein [Vibrio barjaei]
MRKFIDLLSQSNVSLVRQSASVLATFLKSEQLDYQLNAVQKQRLAQYLETTTLVSENFGSPLNAHSVVAFSFGDSEDVNKRLANVATDLVRENGFLDAHIQQEVAEHTTALPNAHVIADDNYQTTTDVARKALDKSVGRNVIVVAQAWHAKRCIETCQEVGLNVVGLRTVDRFPQNDPQPWVRNPINWVLKESQREFVTGQEVSRLLQLA